MAVNFNFGELFGQAFSSARRARENEEQFERQMSLQERAQRALEDFRTTELNLTRQQIANQASQAQKMHDLALKQFDLLESTTVNPNELVDIPAPFRQEGGPTKLTRADLPTYIQAVQFKEDQLNNQLARQLTEAQIAGTKISNELKGLELKNFVDAENKRLAMEDAKKRAFQIVTPFLMQEPLPEEPGFLTQVGAFLGHDAAQGKVKEFQDIMRAQTENVALASEATINLLETAAKSSPEIAQVLIPQIESLVAHTVPRAQAVLGEVEQLGQSAQRTLDELINDVINGRAIDEEGNLTEEGQRLVEKLEQEDAQDLILMRSALESASSLKAVINASHQFRQFVDPINPFAESRSSIMQEILAKALDDDDLASAIKVLQLTDHAQELRQ